MSLLVPENFGGLGQPPAINTYGLRVAGRLAVGDAGLVVYTTDTALARRLAADDVEEDWQIAFPVDPPPDAVDLLRAALGAACRITSLVAAATELRVTAAQLGKGALAEACATLGWQANVRRLRRGEVTLPHDLDEGQWLVRAGRA